MQYGCAYCRASYGGVAVVDGALEVGICVNANQAGLSGDFLARSEGDPLPQMQVRLVTDPHAELGRVWMVHCLVSQRGTSVYRSASPSNRRGRGRAVVQLLTVRKLGLAAVVKQAHTQFTECLQV